MEPATVKKYSNEDLAFRYVDGIFYVNSKQIQVKKILVEAKITLEMDDIAVKIFASSEESEITVKGKLKYDAFG